MLSTTYQPHQLHFDFARRTLPGDLGPPVAPAGGTLRRPGTDRARRTIDDLRRVFDRHEGALRTLYERARRDDPSLQGHALVELTIAPRGAVTAIRLVSSELKARELERRLLARIAQFDFGAREVEAMVLTWPLDFRPSSPRRWPAATTRCTTEPASRC
jgi:hypothetical protein